MRSGLLLPANPAMFGLEVDLFIVPPTKPEGDAIPARSPAHPWEFSRDTPPETWGERLMELSRLMTRPLPDDDAEAI